MYEKLDFMSLWIVQVGLVRLAKNTVDAVVQMNHVQVKHL